METQFDPQTSTQNVYPDSPVPYEFIEEQKIKPLGLGVEKQQQEGIVINLANNTY